MQEILEAVLLGVIEGITEFLPISSTGHLLLAQHWIGYRSDLFNIAIQVGAILGVILVYRQRLLDLSWGFALPENRDHLYKLGAAFFVTSVGGLIAKQAGVELPETVEPIAVALIVGGIAILLIERLLRSTANVERVSWAVAFAVGLSQIVAGVFPGTSRSAAAIFAAMLAGTTSRPAAAEFAFLVGIPTMIAAASYELWKVAADPPSTAENWTSLTIAFSVAAVVAFASVRWLLIYIRSHTFTWFACTGSCWRALVDLAVSENQAYAARFSLGFSPARAARRTNRSILNRSIFPHFRSDTRAWVTRSTWAAAASVIPLFSSHCSRPISCARISISAAFSAGKRS